MLQKSKAEAKDIPKKVIKKVSIEDNIKYNRRLASDESELSAKSGLKSFENDENLAKKVTIKEDNYVLEKCFLCSHKSINSDKCFYCGEWFCKDHIEPRLPHDYSKGHLCKQFTEQQKKKESIRIEQHDKKQSSWKRFKDKIK